MKKIKLGIFFGIFVLIFTLFAGCAATPRVNHVVDDSIPLERSAWINPYNAGTIIGYNGIPVNWRPTGGVSANFIQIPAGDTLLEWNINSYYSGVNYTGNNILFRFNFRPQQQYVFLPVRLDGKSGFRVYAWDIGEKIPSGVYKADHYVGFFPFLNVD